MLANHKVKNVKNGVGKIKPDQMEKHVLVYVQLTQSSSTFSSCLKTAHVKPELKKSCHHHTMNI